MFARGAMWNPAIFLGKPKVQHQATTVPDRMEVLQSYIKRVRIYVMFGLWYLCLTHEMFRHTMQVPLG